MRAQFWRGSVFFLLLLTTSLASFAQVDSARLQGTVTDPQGAAAVGATALITSVETGRANSTTTNDLGFYSASALPPGRYRIEVTQPGFKTISRELELQIAQVGVADFRLDVGDVTQTVTVEAGSPVINPTDSTIGDVVESRQLKSKKHGGCPILAHLIFARVGLLFDVGCAATPFLRVGLFFSPVLKPQAAYPHSRFCMCVLDFTLPPLRARP
jgi:hypothetical protein